MRPDRPIPAGHIAAPVALAAALVLLLAGPLLASWASPRAGMILGCVALFAALYDVAGRGPWRGPILLGACRAGNLGAGVVLGLSATGGAFDARYGLVCSLYAAYVFAVSRLGRLEDLEHSTELGRTPSLWILGAGLSLGALPLLWSLGVFALEGQPALEARSVYLVVATALALWGAAPLLRRAARRAWTPPEVLPVMGIALRRLLVFTAVCALLAGTPAAALVAGLIFCGYPAAYALRRVFPPS